MIHRRNVERKGEYELLFDRSNSGEGDDICLLLSINFIFLDLDGSFKHVRACAVHGAVPDRAGLGQPGSRQQGG